ncbi:hypothetical protein VST7929_00752 [Vibrio stylophorae]|uniref:Prepilin-type N-terminal cleavage/methylation domain-containing protein n=1 Tax=Vibrio stylophorae TaxID=659351 RepID=A0ABM8ZRP3_9VIBR|nr:prepilin-type N-terminal cleavage/methylation domain-containing protein [Vibrio stylophorae]CAH0532904.1 hypothetical protein VST7929_00752 [Vibrio stylophorae]
MQRPQWMTLSSRCSTVNLRQDTGFTLVELVVVIIILGILAVIAVPRLLNLSDEAIISELDAISGSLKSANEVVYSEAVVAGIENQEFSHIHNDNDAKLLINNRQVSLHFGRIQPSVWNIRTVLEIDKSDWNVLAAGGVFGPVYLVPKSAPAFSQTSIAEILQSQCYFAYGFDRKVYRTPYYTIETQGC